MIFRLILLFLTTPLFADPIVVFAASSMKNALDEVAQNWQGEVQISYASSALLARQIDEGAPADIFISANPEWVDELEVPLVQREDFLSNALVIISDNEEPIAPSILIGHKVAMANVESVPAGIYGRQALESLSLWQQIEPNVITGDNVRVALSWVASNEVEYGIVYASDAKAEPRVHAVYEFDPSTHEKILYTIGLLHPDAREFYNHILSSKDVFKAHGFLTHDE